MRIYANVINTRSFRMKKILLAVVICLGLTACGEAPAGKITGGGALSGSYLVEGRGHAKLTFTSDSVALSTQDGSDGVFKYKVNGKNVTIIGFVPSEWYINESGSLANRMNTEIYIKQ